jgi:hypothetical protein
MSALFSTVVAACVTALLGIASYVLQKRADRTFDLKKQQREAYALYLKSYHDWTFTVEDSKEDLEARATYSRAYQDLFPLASDGFLRAATAFHDFVWVPPFPNFSDETDRANFHKLWRTWSSTCVRTRTSGAR